MAGLETLVDRQEEEIQVLQSIYSTDEFKDLRQLDKWKVHRPPEMQLTLRPQESMRGQEAHVSVDVWIKCPSTYPEDVPELKVQNVKGISNEMTKVLLEELTKMTLKLKGEVMILELAQHVQHFLHANNRPPSMSFYEEMMVNQKQQREKQQQEELKKLQLLKKKEEKQLLQLKEEIKRREDALREESRRYKIESQRDSSPSTPSLDIPTANKDKDIPVIQTPPSPDTTPMLKSSASPSNRRRRNSTLRCDDDNGENHKECTDHKGTTTLTFSNKKGWIITRGRCMGHSSRGSTAFTGIDNHTGDMVAVVEWILKWRHTNRRLDPEEKSLEEQNASSYIKSIVTIEQEFLSLCKLRHKNLVHYLAINYCKDLGRIIVHLLQEFGGATSLDSFLSAKIPIGIDQLQHICSQLLDVLVYLHSKSVVHRDLRASSVLLDSRGNVRLNDYSVDKKLNDICMSLESKKSKVTFSDEFLQSNNNRFLSKTDDIFMLGQLVVSLAQGTYCEDQVVNIPSTLPAELQDFISRCVFADEKQRWTAAQLCDHSFIKSPILTVSAQASHHKQTKQQDNEEDTVEDDETYVPYIPGNDFGQSRLKNEFEILKWLGKGGFGDVIKVRNKLDGRFYAIKRIQLNTKSKLFTKKITREVKLLSRLNHEGVVRYYNSWIETSTEEAPSETTTDITSNDNKSSENGSRLSSKSGASRSAGLHNSLGFNDDIEKFAPAPADASVDWSMSASNPNVVDDDSSSDEDEDDEDDEDDDMETDVFGTSFLDVNDDSDDGVIFGDQDDKNWKSEESSLDDKSKSEYAQDSKRETSASTENGIIFEECKPRLQFLYIQMEFCEKSTLRQAIDNDLFEDINRVWRYFREILEGLAHIHEQGMIHRDLKPSNIFLDSSDHVKIGDFGLATTDILCKQQTQLMDLKINLELSASADMGVMPGISQSESLGDGNLTGKVGSALYVSPEMLTTSARAFYSQKVDIYSLGIMFFEMCYRPLKTGMERVQILSNIRQPTIEFPDDFEEDDDMTNQAELIRMMLTHQTDLRPLTEELLQSELLPPPIMEESELNEVLRSTIANPESRAYKLMVHALHSQPVDPATDFTYDLDMHHKQNQQQHQYYLAHMQAMDTLEEIFQCHGGVRMTTPLLMPRSTLYENTHGYICMMDRSGTSVSLPFDLRVPLARYIARNSIHHMKRYSIEKVYREKRMPSLHPMERTECAFDIIMTTPISGVPEAEVLQIVEQVINEYSILQGRGYYIRINHVDLLHAVLYHCGVPEEQHQHVLTILCDNKKLDTMGSYVQGEKGLLQLRTRLYSLSLSDDTINKMLHFMEMEDTLGKLASILRCITKSRDKAASSLARKAIREMEDIQSHLQALDCKLQLCLTVGLVYNYHLSSGTMFQVVAKIKKKRKDVMDVIAAGSRYDGLIKKFQRPGSLATVHPLSISPAAVGVSFQLEKLTSAILEQEEGQRNICEAFICSVGHHGLVKEKLQLLKHLWSAKIKADIFHDLMQSLEEIQDYCKKVGIPQLIVLKDADPETIRVQCFEKDRKKWTEKKISNAWSNMASVTDHIKQNSQMDTGDVVQQSKMLTSQISYETNSIPIQSSSSSSSYSTNFNITFIQAENSKLSANARRRMEAPIFANVSPILNKVSNKLKIEIIVLELHVSVIKTIAAYIELDSDEAAFQDSLSPIIEKHIRFKKYLTKVFDYIHDLRFDKKCSGILLYGTKDESYKLLLMS